VAAALAAWEVAAASRAAAWARHVQQLKGEVDRSFEALEALSAELHRSGGASSAPPGE
jgi:hypothetical protein